AAAPGTSPCPGEGAVSSNGTRPLRIAMVIDSWDDANNGAVFSTRRFTELLRAQGHTVTIIAAAARAAGTVALRPFYPPFGGRIMREMRQPFAWPTPELLVPAIREQDIIHVQFPFYLGARAITVAREAGIPVVSTFHVQAEHILYNIGIRNQAMVNALYKL